MTKRERRFLTYALIVGILLVWGTSHVPSRGARESACRSACESNLRQIYAVLQEFRSAHDGAYPTSLDELCPRYMSDHQRLRCVATKREFIYLGTEGPLSDDDILA